MHQNENSWPKTKNGPFSAENFQCIPTNTATTTNNKNNKNKNNNNNNDNTAHVHIQMSS